MNALLVDVLGFLFFYPTDWLQLRGWARARAPLLLVGAAVQVYVFSLALEDSGELGFSGATVWLGWVLLPVAFGLLVYTVLVSGSKNLLMAAPVWMGREVGWVVFRDRLFFPCIFPRYTKYARITPMLIPTRKSIRAYPATLGAQER